MFADLYTVLICMDYFNISSQFLLVYPTPRGKLLNTTAIFALYLIAMLALMWLFYKCYQFLGARNAHDEMRRMEKEREKQALLDRFKTIQASPETPLKTLTTPEYQMAPPILERSLEVEEVTQKMPQENLILKT